MLYKKMNTRTVLSVALLLTLSLTALSLTFSGTNRDRHRFDRADQTLSAEEAKRLAELMRKLEDRKVSMREREEAARKIGEELPHKSAIPVLAKVVKDTKDNRDVRYWALTALSQIADKSVIPLVIEALSDPTPQIRFRADEQLWKLAGERPHNVIVSSPDISSKELGTALSSWKKWWQKNKKTFKFVRTRVLFEY